MWHMSMMWCIDMLAWYKVGVVCVQTTMLRHAGDILMYVCIYEICMDYMQRMMWYMCAVTNTYKTTHEILHNV